MSSADLAVLRYIEESTIGVTPDDSVKSTGTLTGSANFANGETVTIDGKVYTFQAALTNVNGNVLIGASLTASLANLLNAINFGVGAGTTYATAMTEHPTVEATASNATTLSVRAKNSGTGGNTLATTETSANASWGGATLSGGSNSTVTEWKPLRYTGESLNFNIENTQSEEITPTRTESDLVQTSSQASGDINIELSYGTFADFLAAVLCNSWSGNVLTNGTQRKSFTIQKHFQDMDVPQFHMYRGSCIEGLTLSMELDKIVSGAFNIISFGLDQETGVLEQQIAGSTFAAATTTTPMNAVVNLQDFTIDGVPYSGCISKLSLNIKNNIRAIRCLGSLNPKNMKLGTIQISGEMEFYFSEGTNYKKFVAGQEFDFGFALEDDAGNRYDFVLPRCKFETGEVVAGGRNTDVMFSATWRGFYDQSAGHVLQLTATPA